MRTSTSVALSAALLTVTMAGAAPAPPLLPDVVVMETNLGKVRIKLYPDKAPQRVANFLRYVDDKYYDDTIMHRVIPNFVIQGGGYDADMTEKKMRDPVKNEAGNGLANKRGTVAVARKADPDSGQAQFYINLKDNDTLDRTQRKGYCVFGEVVEGMDVVDKIAQVQTGERAGHRDVPVQPVVIKSIRRAMR